jgi:DNA invertase Pin-like site-specific DNA recombinase
MTKLAAGYIRCSTRMQEDSPEEQRRDILDYATKHDFEIVEWFVDVGKTGTNFDKRAEFQRLWKVVQNKPRFHHVIAYDESRWGRPTDPEESAYWRVLFRKYRIEVVLVKTSVDSSHEFAPVIQSLEAVQASSYSKKLSELTLRGQKLNAGRGYHCGGTPPYGFKRIALDIRTGEKVRDLEYGQWRRSKEEKVVFDLGDPAEVRTVQRIFQLRLQELGYRAIAAQLNAEGVPCAKRGRWRNTDRKWSTGTIAAIVENPAYMGARAFNRHPQSHMKGTSKQAWKNNVENWVLHEDAHPAIVSKEVWHLANDARKPYSRKNRFFLESAYLLSGILRCTKCGFNFQGITKRVKKTNGQLYKKGYYQDGGFHAKGSSVCESFLIKQEEIEGFVLESIQKKVLNRSFLKALEAKLRDRLVSQKVEPGDTRTLRKSLADKKASLKKYFTLLESGADLSEVRSRIEDLENEIKAVQRSLDESNAASFTSDQIEVVVGQVQGLVERFKTTFERAPMYLRKSLIRRFVEKVEVDPKTRAVTVFMKTVPLIDHPLAPVLDGGHTKSKMIVKPRTSRNGRTKRKKLVIAARSGEAA